MNLNENWIFTNKLRKYFSDRWNVPIVDISINISSCNNAWSLTFILINFKAVDVVRVFSVHFLNLHIVIKFQPRSFFSFSSFEINLCLIETSFRNFGFPHFIDSIIETFYKVPSICWFFEKHWHLIEAASYVSIWINEYSMQERISLIENFFWLSLHFLSCLRYINKINFAIMSYERFEICKIYSYLHNIK